MMRYLTIAAEYTQSPLRDDFQGPIDPESVGLPPSIRNALEDWNTRYREIIPIAQEQRQEPSTAEKIEQLDKEGIELCNRVAEALAT